jgi:hypothetical protein
LPWGAVRLRTEQDPERPNPTFIPVANRFAAWLADRTGGLAQSSLFEAVANIPSTAHILGGAVIAADPSRGVVDAHQRVFGYQNLLVCDGSAVPANVGVNPSLTIAAMAERAIALVPARADAAPTPARCCSSWHRPCWSTPGPELSSRRPSCTCSSSSTSPCAARCAPCGGWPWCRRPRSS